MQERKKREGWASRMGFIMAAAGSAVGLANIWRFPYIVGSSGGAAFVFCYLICLAIIGLPVFASEILLGRQAQTGPIHAFPKVTARKGFWRWPGRLQVATGFIVSAFYSAIAGVIFGYFFEALRGNLHEISTANLASIHYEKMVADPFWVVGFHFLFLFVCAGILFFGVRQGIERASKFLMPLLFAVLFALAVRGLLLPGAMKGIQFLLTPEWGKITPGVILAALGQSFFTLSLGQGTMITYGSYLKKEDSVLGASFPVVAMDTIVSLIAAVAVMTVVFSAGIAPSQGPGLLFETLPIVFSQTSGGYFLAVGFFLLVSIAAVTSEISAMEPTIAFLEEKGWSRHKATIASAIGVFVLGIPCALSFGVFQESVFLGKNVFDLLVFLSLSILVPLGGLASVVAVSWVWGEDRAIKALGQNPESIVGKSTRILLRYLAPLLIIVVFVHAVLG